MRFVVICARRTGSSHLVNVLSGHPDLLVNGNIFYAHNRSLYVFWPDEDLTPDAKAELIELRSRDPESFLERVFETSYGRDHVGFKIFSGENDTILYKLIKDKNVRKIVLYRRNVLANFSSALIAAKTRTYGLTEGKVPENGPKIRFVSKRFIRFSNEYTGFFRDVVERLNEAEQSFILVDYEDINEPHVIKNIVTFVGGDNTKSISKEKQYKRQIKQNASNILARFSNPKEVKNFLRENNLLNWMYEGNLSFEGFLPQAMGGTDQAKLKTHDIPMGNGKTITAT